MATAAASGIAYVALLLVFFVTELRLNHTHRLNISVKLFHFDFFVATSIDRQQLIDQKGVVKRLDEEFLIGGKTSAL